MYASKSDGSGGGKEPKFPRKKREEVRLNRAILMKGITSVSCDKRDSVEVDKQFPLVTHLHLQGKGIDVLGSLHHFSALTVLYLYDNRIRQIIGLESLGNLETLYLQKNRLEKISGLLGCKRLRKLYLGQNEIVVVEGLHLLTHLEEFHVEQQRLQPGEQLIFDPTTLDTLSKCLEVLNIGGNGVTSLEDFAGMRKLHTLSAQDNDISDLEKTSLVLSTLPKLKVVDLQRNPIAKSPKYKEKLIGHCHAIELLDGKTYSSNSRHFLNKFCEMKASNLRRSLAAMNVEAANSNISQVEGSTGTLPHETKSSLVHDISSGSLRQIYPFPPQESTESVERSEADELGRRLARIRLIGQYSNQNIQSQVMDMARSRRNMTLVKPQEIRIPQFILAPKLLRVQSSTENSVAPGNYAPKSKIYRGLGSKGYSMVTNLPVAPGRRPSGMSHWSTASIDGMMPVSRSIQNLQGQGGGDEGAGNVVQGQESGSVSWTLPPEPQIMKLPPWPHILRNLGTTEKVNFI